MSLSAWQRKVTAHSTSVGLVMSMSSSVMMTCLTVGRERRAEMAFLPSPARFLMATTTDQPQQPPSVA